MAGTVMKLDSKQFSDVASVACDRSNIPGHVKRLLLQEPWLGDFRIFFDGVAQEYDRNHPLGFGVMDSVNIFRSEIDLLFVCNPVAMSARDIVARLPDMQLGGFVERTGLSMYDFATREHPDWEVSFSFNGRQMKTSSVLFEGGKDASYPPFRALIVHIVELFEQDHPRTHEETVRIIAFTILVHLLLRRATRQSI
ncbi:MAG: hypothetical protein LBJ96_02450 [Holosporaceae bacterium]|jgi:hypothetical protein|nr:hypothetical protein [Holosporaceae bacterium]